MLIQKSFTYYLSTMLIIFLLSLLFIIPAYAAEQGTAYYWNFNSNSNELVKGKYNGDNSGVNYVDGKYGKAAEFTGDNSYFDFGETDINFGKSFTVAFWMKAVPSDTFSVILAKGPKDAGHFEIFLHKDDGSLRIYAPDMGDVITKFIATDNVWHHVAVVYDAQVIKIYVDGSEIYSGNTIADVKDETDYFVIGSLVDFTLPYIGQLDEMYILSWPVDKAKVNEIMNNSFKLELTAATDPTATTNPGTNTATNATANTTANKTTSPISTSIQQKSPNSTNANVLNNNESNFLLYLIIGIIVALVGVTVIIFIVIKKKKV